MRDAQLDAIKNTLSQFIEAHLKAALYADELKDLIGAVGVVHAKPGNIPQADESRFCIVWQNRTCHLGHTITFALFARLLRRVNHFVSHDQLLQDVGDGDMRSPDTVRSAVRELKTKLCRARMKQIARAIQGQGQHYGLILHPRHRK